LSGESRRIEAHVGVAGGETVLLLDLGVGVHGALTGGF
jgi:hypothetical protein